MTKHIGKLIREVRESRNMTLEELAEGIVSTTFLSKFERGEHDIASEKLLLLLDKLNFSLFELTTLESVSKENNQQNFLTELSDAVKLDNIHHLERLQISEDKHYKKFLNVRHNHNVILTKQFINRINNVPFDSHLSKEIANYLFEVEDWYFYDLTLFSHSTFFLPVKTVKMLINLAIKNATTFSDKKHYRLELGNVIILMLENNEMDYAHKLLLQIEQFLSDTRFYDQITKVNFLKGLYLIKSGSPEEGKSLASEAISVMNYMRNHSQSLSHQNYLDDFISRIN